MSTMSSVAQVKPVAQTIGILQDFCNETLMSENINVTILSKLVKITKHIEKYGPSQRQLLQPIIHCAANMLSTTKNEESVKPHMPKLSFILKQCLNRAHKIVMYSSSPAKLDFVTTSIVTEIEDMIKKKPKLKSYILETLFEPLVDLITSSHLSLVDSLEAITLMNLMLRGTSRDVRIGVRQTNKIVIENLLVRLTLCGDYEIQQGITEILLRLAPTEQRINVGDAWFAGNSVLVTKFSKLGAHDFEAECREFLSVMNRVIGINATVFTYTCESIYIGNCKMSKPKSAIYKNLLMDLNMKSTSMTFCCCDDIHDAVLVRVNASDLKNASLVPIDNQLLQITLQIVTPFQEFQQTKLKDDTLIRIILRNDTAVLPKQLKKLFGSKIEIHDSLLKNISDSEADTYPFIYHAQETGQRVSEGVKLVQQPVSREIAVSKTKSTSVNKKKKNINPPLLSRNPADIPESETPSTGYKDDSPPKYPFTPNKLTGISTNNATHCKRPLKPLQAEAPSTPVKKTAPAEAVTVSESAGLPDNQCQQEVSKQPSEDNLIETKSVKLCQGNKEKTVANKLNLRGNKHKVKQTDDQKPGSCTTLPDVKSQTKCNQKPVKNYTKCCQKQDETSILHEPRENCVTEPVLPIGSPSASSNSKSRTATEVSSKPQDADPPAEIKNTNYSKTKEIISTTSTKEYTSTRDINPPKPVKSKVAAQKHEEDASCKNKELKSAKNKIKGIGNQHSRSKIIKPLNGKEIQQPYQQRTKQNKKEDSTQESDALDAVAQLFQSPAPSKIRLSSRSRSRKSRLPHLEFLNEEVSTALPLVTPQKRRLFKPSTPLTTFEETHSETSKKGSNCTMKVNQTFQLKNSLHIEFCLNPKTSCNSNAAKNVQPSVYSDFEELGGTLDKWNKKEALSVKSYNNKNKKVCAKKRGYHISSVQLHPVDDFSPAKRPCILKSIEKEPALFTSFDKHTVRNTKPKKPVKNKCTKRQINKSKSTRNEKENPKKTQIDTQRGRKKTNDSLLKELENIWSQKVDDLPDLVIEKEIKAVPVTKPSTPPFLKCVPTVQKGYLKPPMTYSSKSNSYQSTASQESCDLTRAASSPCTIMLPQLSLPLDNEPCEPDLPPDFGLINNNSTPPVDICTTQRNVDLLVSTPQEISKVAYSAAQTTNLHGDKRTKQKYFQKSIINSDQVCDKKQLENIKNAGTKGPIKNDHTKLPSKIAASIEVSEPMSNIKSNKTSSKITEKLTKMEEKKRNVDSNQESDRSKSATCVGKKVAVSETENNPMAKLSNPPPTCNQVTKDKSKLSLKTHPKADVNNKNTVENARQNDLPCSLSTLTVTQNEKNNTQTTNSDSKRKKSKEDTQFENKKTKSDNSVQNVSPQQLTELGDMSRRAVKTSDIKELKVTSGNCREETEKRQNSENKSTPINFSIEKNYPVEYKSSQTKSNENCTIPSTYIAKKQSTISSDISHKNRTGNKSTNVPKQACNEPNCTEKAPQCKDQVIHSDLDFVVNSQPVLIHANLKPVTFPTTSNENIPSCVQQAIIPESTSLSPSDENSPKLPAPIMAKNTTIKKKQEINENTKPKESSKARISSQQKPKKLTKIDIAAELEYLSHNKKYGAKKRGVLKEQNQESSSELSVVPSSDSESEQKVEVKKKKFNHPISVPKPKYPVMNKPRHGRFNPKYNSTLIAGPESSSQSQKLNKPLHTEKSLSTIAEVNGLVSEDGSENEIEEEKLLSRSALAQRSIQKSYTDELIRVAGNWTRKTVQEVTSRRCEMVQRFLSVLDLEAEQAEERLEQITELQVRVCKSRNLVLNNFARLNNVLEDQSTRDEVVLQQCTRIKHRLQKQLSRLLQSHCKELMDLTNSLKAECHDMEVQNIASSMRAKLSCML